MNQPFDIESPGNTLPPKAEQREFDSILEAEQAADLFIRQAMNQPGEWQGTIDPGKYYSGGVWTAWEKLTPKAIAVVSSRRDGAILTTVSFP